MITTQTKIVGIVIPIYNVEKYLKECLDSVINQTYTNLEIILVNDGSTDENSLNIAKEYALKDKRIILFDKKNGGLSSARNVGIDFFSGEYRLKNKTQALKENSLIEFNIEGNNPYEIYTVYKSFKAFNSGKDLARFTYPCIDYIVFLDSDDYWELNCIEECVPRMDGVEVVWFDYRFLYDGVEKLNKTSFLDIYNFDNSKIISVKEWLEKSIEKGINSFALAWSALINFDYLKNIKLNFINGIIHEDHHFGICLFSQVKYIYVFLEKKYIYRIRENSICDYLNNKNTNPKYKNYLRLFHLNSEDINKYHYSSSFFITYLFLFNFIERDAQEDIRELLKKVFFNYRSANRFLEVFMLSNKNIPRVLIFDLLRNKKISNLNVKYFLKLYFTSMKIVNDILKNENLNYRIKHRKLNETKKELNETKKELNETKKELNEIKKELKMLSGEISSIQNDIFYYPFRVRAFFKKNRNKNI